jgi:hypothetical protein
MLRSLSRVVLGVSLLAPFAQARDIVVVEGPAAGVYVALQDAIDAARDGDVLLIGPGSHPAFILDGKGLTLAAMPNASVIVGYGSQVRNVPAGSFVLLERLVSGGAPLSGADGLILTNNAGHVRLQGCSWRGANGLGSPAGIHGGDGVWIDSCARVVLVRCDALGGAGKNSAAFVPPGGDGGAALRASASKIAIHQGTLRGGQGGTAGGDGGDGVRATHSELFAAGALLIGGNGGNAPSPGLCEGSGGDSLELATSEARLLDLEYVRGASGAGAAPAGCNGVNGRTRNVLQSLVTFEAGAARVLSGPSFVRDSQPLVLAIEGSALDTARLRTNRRAAWNWGATAIGPLLVPAGEAGSLQMLGVVPPSGQLAAIVAPRALASGRIARVDFAQLIADPSQGARLHASPLHVVVFDDNAGPDCNSNGVPDAFDIATRASLDLDFDGRPDECP